MANWISCFGIAAFSLLLLSPMNCPLSLLHCDERPRCRHIGKSFGKAAFQKPFQPTFLVLEEDEENLIAATKNIVKAFESNKKLTSDTRKILRDLSVRLYNVAVQSEEKEATSEIEELFNKFEERIMKWEVDQSVIIWDCGHDQAHEYLNAVDKARKLIGRFERLNLCKGNEETELLKKAHDILKIGMVRLEREFKHLLVQNRQPFEIEAGRMSYSDDSVDFRSSFGDDSIENVIQHNHDIALVIPWLQTIAKLMFDSNYGRECSRAYVSARKVSHDECLCILEVDKYRIEDVLKMEWGTLDSKIRKWIRAVGIFVRVYLVSEKWLIDEIFKDLGTTTTTTDCFLESTKAPLLQLLRSCDIGKLIRMQQPEKLIPMIDSYEVLAGIVRDMNLLYSTESETATSIQMESQDILGKLRDCVKATIFKFEKAVASARKPTNIPSNPGIYHLTRYVMSYLEGLSCYTKTLDMILKGESSYTDALSVFKSLLLILETNLDDMSKLYENEALQHLFLMNNVHYMADKVNCSEELRNFLGDDWIRERTRKIQQQAMSYERVSWSSILALLKDDGLYNSGSNSISRTILKDKLQSFNLAFEKVYKIHTGWIVPDDQLREDLRISISLKVIQAYRTFVGRHGNHIRDKKIKIKYSVDELENLLLDFFEGSQKSL